MGRIDHPLLRSGLKEYKGIIKHYIGKEPRKPEKIIVNELCTNFGQRANTSYNQYMMIV